MSIQVPKRTAALRENGLFEKSNRAGQDITFIPHRPAGFEKWLLRGFFILKSARPENRPGFSKDRS
jgi:hypothetical protein